MYVGGIGFYRYLYTYSTNTITYLCVFTAAIRSN